MSQSRLIPSKAVFYTFLLTIGATVLIVFLTGLDIKRSIYHNTMLTLSILSLFFFFTISLGLFFGLKLKNTWGKGIKKIDFSISEGLPIPDSFLKNADLDLFDIDEGIGGIILAILLWIAVLVFIIVISFVFEAFLFSFIAIFAGMLYWIFYRAIRLVLKNSAKCKGDLMTSIGFGMFYTLLYVGWIYMIVFVVHLL